MALSGAEMSLPRNLRWFLCWEADNAPGPEELLQHFIRLDDHDVTVGIKYWSEASDFTLQYLSKGLLDRRLFRLEWHNEPVSKDYLAKIQEKVSNNLGNGAILEHLVYTGSESNRAYDDSREQIKILFKNGKVLPIDQCSDVPLYTQLVTKHFICYPKIS